MRSSGNPLKNALSVLSEKENNLNVDETHVIYKMEYNKLK